MKCGVKFCGGCNPRFQRGEALQKIKEQFLNRIEFSYAEEEQEYDLLLIICGCPNCCASYSQYRYRLGCLKMWDESHVTKIIDELELMQKEWSEEGKTFELAR